MGTYLVVTYADTSFLQIHSWERLKTLGPKPAKFKAVDMVDVEDDDENEKSVLDKPFKMRTSNGLV